MTVGQRIRQLRKSKGMSQEALGTIVDTPNCTVSFWETGKFCPSLQAFRRVCKALDVSMDEFMEGVDLD